jgi:serine/threonine protein kinase
MFHMKQTVIGERYTLVELLGEGGMARVYRAHDDVLDRHVALKVLRERYADDDSFAERFRSEARNAASLTHPGVVQVYDQGCDEDGTYYIAMEYVPGGTLKNLINEAGPFDPEEAARIARRVAEALGAAHEHGIVHRDVTSQNILLGATGEAKVGDFGIARAASSKTVTETNVVLGTAAYMSPEQVRSERVGPASDLYSLGVVLYEMLTGELPYKADDPIATAIKHLEEPPPRPKALSPAVPAGLDALTVKLLAKNPEDRFPNAAELAEDLRPIGDAFPPLAALQDADQSATVEETTAPMSTPEQRTHASATEAVAPGGGANPAEKSRRQRILLPLVALLLVFVFFGGLAWVFLPSDVARSTSPQNKPPQNPPQASDAPPKVEVPDVVGLSSEEARRRLDEVGLEIGSRQETESEKVAEGLVIEQHPAAGIETERDSAVDVVLSMGPPQDPSSSASSSASASASSSASASASASASSSATPASASANASPVGATKVKVGVEQATPRTDVRANQPPPSGAKKLQVKPVQDEPAQTGQGKPAK